VSQRFRIVSEADAHVIELLLPAHIEALEFDSINTDIAEQIIARGSSAWVIDLTGALYIGSALLGLLINVRTKVRQSHGTLTLCSMDAALERVLRVGSMERLFTIVNGRREALKK